MNKQGFRFGVLLLLFFIMVLPLFSDEQAGKLVSAPASGMTLPESGATDSFAYSRSSQHEGMYEVRLGGQSDQPVYVSENTLGLLLSSPVPAGVKSAFVSQYPYQMLNMYEHVLNNNYPDDAETYRDDPFPAWQGGGVSVDQDPMAPNYVRVRMPDENGNMQEFSISRKSMDEIFNLEMDPAIFAQAVKEFPYRLPEKARVNFKYLSREQMIDLIEQEPGMARQEFTQVKRIYLNPPVKTDVDTSILNEPPLLAGDVPPAEYGPDTVMPPIAPVLKPASEARGPAASNAATAGPLSPSTRQDDKTASNRLLLILAMAVAVIAVASAGVVVIRRR